MDSGVQELEMERRGSYGVKVGKKVQHFRKKSKEE